MGKKSRPLGYFNVTVCFRGECVYHNTEECNDCLRFDKYKKRRKNGNKRRTVNTD